MILGESHIKIILKNHISHTKSCFDEYLSGVCMHNCIVKAVFYTFHMCWKPDLDTLFTKEQLERKVKKKCDSSP